MQVAERTPFEAKWRLAGASGSPLLYSDFQCIRCGKSSPAQILQFPVILPHKFQDAEKFNLQFSDFSEITETADKLRWLRYQKGLRQRDVADYAGIDRSTYVHYEESGKDLSIRRSTWRKSHSFLRCRWKRCWMTIICFFGKGQGEQIKTIRTKLGLTQKQYADKLGVSLGSLKQWERNRKQIFKSTWEKYFKQGLENYK